jgi:hypothetical protein
MYETLEFSLFEKYQRMVPGKLLYYLFPSTDGHSRGDPATELFALSVILCALIWVRLALRNPWIHDVVD